MKTDLLTSLRKYKKTANADPIENFITEAFAWLLKNHDNFSSFFIKEIQEKLNSNITIPKKVNWVTQKNCNGVFPDMVCEFENSSFIFEHKARCPLHEGQLNNYRKYANENYSTYYIILITAQEKEHTQNPDLALCWRHIYKIIERWLNDKSDEDLFMFKSFQNLLVNEGMGPPSPISHNSILSYYSARNFKKETLNLITRIFNNKKKTFESIFNEDYFNLTKQDNYCGRIGLSMFDLNNWKPGIFVGFMIDGEDHKTKSILGERSPDFSIILSFDGILHKIYPKNENYQNLVNYLQKEIEKLNDNWNFYNHIEDEMVTSPNPWHPIHIRKPMLDLFRGTSTAEEQDKKFIEATKTILQIITVTEYYVKLKNDLKIKI